MASWPQSLSLYFLLLAQITALTAFPLYFTRLISPVRQVHFYVFLSLLLLIGDFMGNIYTMKIADGIIISGGNLCYGAFMATAVMFVWIENDAFILKHLARLVILVNLFNVVFSFLTSSILQTIGIINPHHVSFHLFEVSTHLIIIGGFMILIELLILFLIFELSKKHIIDEFVNGLIYICAFVAMLVLDGAIFEIIASGSSKGIISLTFGGLAGKIIVAAAFSISLAIFMAWQRTAFRNYLRADTLQWRLLTISSTDLLLEMKEKDRDIQRGDTIFRNASEGLAIVDARGVIHQANAAFHKMVEAGRNNFWNVRTAFRSNGVPLEIPTLQETQWRNEVSFGKAAERTGILSITPIREKGEDIGAYVYSLTDITEQKETREQLRHLALYDRLTGLPNRRFLAESLRDIEQEHYALVIIDLDAFKDINHSYGYETGDHVLRTIGSRLEGERNKTIGPYDLVCRIGGDKFAILHLCNDATSATNTIEAIQAIVRQTIPVTSTLNLHMSCTAGVSFKFGSQKSASIEEADAALHDAKNTRQGSFCIYSEQLTIRSQRRAALSIKLRNAIENGAIEVYYQPQFDARTLELKGAEALARWTDIELGPISPGEFIPIAESTGLIVSLGDYVLQKTCADGREWLDKGFKPITLSVNLSAKQLVSDRFTSFLRSTLETTKFPAQFLELELTESILIDQDNENIRRLSEIREDGIRIAIDDFGTGYSALSYLKNIPCDCVKIDRSFVCNIVDDDRQRKLFEGIVQLAKAMSYKIIVEGVEKNEQLECLTTMNCDLIQGCLLSPPVSRLEIEKLLAQHWNSSVEVPQE